METGVTDVMQTVALVCSVAVSLASALIAYTAVRNQQNLAKHTANLDRLNRAADLVLKSPNLLEFHGVSINELREDGISEDEIIYLFYLFEAGDIYYTIEGSRDIKLRNYRKVMLQHPKVRLAWRKYLDNKIFHSTPFTDAVNKFIKDNYLEE